MPSIILSDNGVSSGSAGLKSTAASDGALALQTTTSGGTATNAIYVDNNQQVGLGTSAPDNILHLYASAPRLTFTATNNSSGARYNTLGTATTGAHRFQYGGTDVLVAGITGYTTALQGASSVAGTGITFPATQVASTDANTLDDYEEGTCNLSLAFGGASVGITYSNQLFSYTKIGRQVTLTGELNLSNKGSSTGTASLTGLPFPVISGVSGYGSGSVSYTNGMSFTGMLGVVSIPSASTAGFNVMNNGAISAVTNTNFTNSSDILFSLTYFTT